LKGRARIFVLPQLELGYRDVVVNRRALQAIIARILEMGECDLVVASLECSLACRPVVGFGPDLAGKQQVKNKCDR
jgi:hypothetical protein